MHQRQLQLQRAPVGSKPFLRQPDYEGVMLLTNIQNIAGSQFPGVFTPYSPNKLGVTILSGIIFNTARKRLPKEEPYELLRSRVFDSSDVSYLAISTTLGALTVKQIRDTSRYNLLVNVSDANGELQDEHKKMTRALGKLTGEYIAPLPGLRIALGQIEPLASPIQATDQLAVLNEHFAGSHITLKPISLSDQADFFGR